MTTNSTITQEYLADLRNERDSWTQAKRQIQTMYNQHPFDIKVQQCLSEAHIHATKMEEYAAEVLKIGEEIVAKLEAL
jgi:hypothetical protein